MKKLFIGYYDYPYVMTAYEYNGEIMTGLVPADLDKEVLKAVNEYIDDDFNTSLSRSAGTKPVMISPLYSYAVITYG